jgi:hypothetical protein
VSGVTVRLMSDGELTRLEVLRDLDQKRLTTEAAAQLLGLDTLGSAFASAKLKQKAAKDAAVNPAAPRAALDPISPLLVPEFFFLIARCSGY